MYSINVSDIYYKAFPASAGRAVYAIDPPTTTKDKGNAYTSIKTITRESFISSPYGTPVAMPIMIRGGNYKERIDGKVELISYDDYMFNPTTIVEFQKSKLIVTTPRNGRGGEEKELISDGDWKITIKGFLTNMEYQADTNSFILGSDQMAPPEQAIKSLERLVAVPKEVRVVSDIFGWLKISLIVFQSVSVLPLDGFPGIYSFEVAAMSDTPAKIYTFQE